MAASGDLIIDKITEWGRAETNEPGQQPPSPSKRLQQDEHSGRLDQPTRPIPDDQRALIPSRWFAGNTGDLTLIRREDHGTVNVTTGQPGRSAVAQGASAIDEHNKGHFPHRLTLSDARQV
jgi:hypothetical protein